jgi:cytochrome c oxidase cbb3-type subunit 3
VSFFLSAMSQWKCGNAVGRSVLAGRCLSTILLAAALGACSNEARNVGPTVPQTAPMSDEDPRIPAYQANFAQIAQGGRYFAWYGCSNCHTENGAPALNLADDDWSNGAGFAAVYRSIAGRHGRPDYATRIPAEQIWQLTAFVRDLPKHHPEKRRRSAVDQRAEPQGSRWTGPQ